MSFSGNQCISGVYWTDHDRIAVQPYPLEEYFSLIGKFRGQKLLSLSPLDEQAHMILKFI
jgi:hypothetical protein